MESSYNRTRDMLDISFQLKDTQVAHFTYEDALVITLDISNFNMQRLLVDNGSSMNIVFLIALEAIGISKLELDKSNAILIGFNRKKTRLSGSIKLLVLIRGVTQLTTFLVIDTLFRYNAILRRPWIHAMKAIPSTLH